MHDAQLKRLQRVNEKRLISHLLIELKSIFQPEQAELIAHGIASLSDGIWLRGTGIILKVLTPMKHVQSSMTT